MTPFCDKCLDTGWNRPAVSASPPWTAYRPPVERCVCWSTNPVLARRRERQDARLAKRAREARKTAAGRDE